MKKNIRAVSLVFVLVISLLCLSACGKHKHTYAEAFSYDAENHWRQAICEHREEKKDFGAHQFTETGDTCKTCGYQTVSLQVKTNTENTEYIRTQPVFDMLQLGFVYGGNTDDVKWVSAQQNNIDSYTISKGVITVKVSAVLDNIRYTNEITVSMDESPIGVEAFFAKNAGDTCVLNGIVAGFSTTGNNNEVVLADKQTGKLVSVIKMGTGKLLYGGYYLPGVEIGDEIIIPVPGYVCYEPLTRVAVTLSAKRITAVEWSSVSYSSEQASPALTIP